MDPSWRPVVINLDHEGNYKYFQSAYFNGVCFGLGWAPARGRLDFWATPAESENREAARRYRELLLRSYPQNFPSREETNRRAAYIRNHLPALLLAESL